MTNALPPSARTQASVPGLSLAPWLLALALAAVPAAGTRAAPYIPTSATQVLERLPARNDPVQRSLADLRARLAANPGNVALAAELARRYIGVARAEADPRYLGYAQAVLAPWWGQPRPPAEVLVLRATILQSTHQFGPALADLDALLAANPQNGQAWITRATVLQVQGNFAEAMKSCARLLGIAPDLVVRTCQANVANLTGSARASYASLRASVDASPGSPSALRAWSQTLLAEMAQRQGDTAMADRHFREALSLDPDDSYLLGAYADFLLDQGRAADVVTLVQGKTKADGLLLRYALALAAQQSPNAPHFTDLLRYRFEAAALRADTVHQREQSRFELQLMKNPVRALALAQQNWGVQKEPADARVYLEAALAAHDRAAAQPVLAWLQQTGLQDAALARLKLALERLS